MRDRKGFRLRIAFVLLVVGFLITLLFTIYPPSWFWVRGKLNPNTVNVTISNPVNKDFVVIIWCADNAKCDTIFNRGHVIKTDFKEKGRNSFQVFYDDSLISVFSHLKKENWEGYTYNFHIKKEFSRITAEVSVGD